MHYYRVRRSWLLAEALLGYLAVALGVSLMFFEGYLSRVIYATGEGWPIMLSLLLPGAGLLLYSLRGHLLVEQYPSGEHPSFCTMAKARRMFHTLLAVGWASLFIVLVFYADRKIIFMLLIAPALFAVHIRGAWENVKANRQQPVGGFRTVGDLVRNSVGSGNVSHQ